MRISTLRFIQLVLALSAGTTLLGMTTGLLLGRDAGGATMFSTIAGLGLLGAAVLCSGMATRPFGMSISLPYVTPSPHYMGIDALTGDDLRRTQAAYEEQVRRSGPIAVLLGVSAVCTLVLSGVLNSVL